MQTILLMFYLFHSQLTEVEEFVHAVNTILQKQEEVDKVKNIMTQIDSYSAISYSDSDKV